MSASTPDPIDQVGDGINDTVLSRGRNGSIALGAVEKLIAKYIRYHQHCGRPVGHFWGGWDGYAAITGATAMRFARLDMLDGGCADFGALMHVINTAADMSTTAGIKLNGNYTATPGQHGVATYPEPLQIANVKTPTVSPAVATGHTVEQILDFDSVYPMAGCFLEKSVPAVVDPSTTIVTSGFRAGADIIATQTGSYGTTEQLVDRFQHLWKNKRPVWTWNTQEDAYVQFSTSPQQYRYIFNQAIGSGGGVAPSVTGPAMTVPLYYSAAGRDSTVRVYVWVYAAMSGSTDSGTIAIANRTGGGSMSTFTSPANPVTIGGTGYAWYPSLGAFNPTTHMYFDARADMAYDRVCLGGRSEGATDKLRIRGFMMAVVPSRA